MKKAFGIVLLITLLLLSSYSLGDEDYESILTSESWKSSDQNELTIKKDHTAEMNSNGYIVQCKWKFDNPVFTLTYELYGTRSFEFILEKTSSGWQLGTDEGAYYPKSLYGEIMASSTDGIDAYPIQLGETIRLPFANITFNTASVVQQIGLRTNNAIFLPSAPGYRFFELNGNIENLYQGELDATKVTGQMVVNDQYVYSLSAQLNKETTGNASLFTISPKSSCNYSLYASLPMEMIEECRTISVLFSINTNYSSSPKQLGDGDFIFRIDLSEDEVTVAKKGPILEMQYFDECPILPKPTSYLEIKDSGSSSSSSNGKKTRIEYRYMPIPGVKGDSASSLVNTYLERVKETGLSVQGNDIYAGSIKLAEVKLESERIVFDIVPGNENLTAMPDSSIEESAKLERLHIGDTINAHTAKLKLVEAGTSANIYSSIKQPKNGYYEFYESNPGKVFYYILTDISNTGTVPIDIRHIYAEIIVDDTYHFDADSVGVLNGSSRFFSDLSPLDKASCMIYAEIPQAAINQAKKIVLKIGFTDDFSILFVSGGLPLFEHCDEVYEVELKK